MNAKTPTLLLALSEIDRARFFSTEAMEQLRRLPLSLTEIDLESTEKRWPEILRQVQPEIILGAWSLPEISAEIVREFSALRYVCYLCGSLRGRIDRSFLKRGGLVSN